MIPLFLTPMSLSSQSAIGVQTKLMLEHFPDWRHLYWDARDFGASDPRSTSADSFLFTHFTVLKHEPPTIAGRALSAVGLTWWNRNELRERYVRRVVGCYGSLVNAAYAAPCSLRDSTRMRSILAALKKPFVLHLWDLLDKHQAGSEAFQWLLKSATKVFCVSEPLVDLLSPFRPDATILRFHRNPTSHLAAPPSTGPLRIALIGNCRRYPEGLSLLREAVFLLKQNGVDSEVVYIGTRKNVNTWSSSLSKEVATTGFLASDDLRDEALAKCHVGFLPGPLEDPGKCMLSRFSIPSRVLDYMATRLPIIAAVHPSSATAMFLESIGLTDCILEPSAQRLARQLTSLSATEDWRHYSAMSGAAFQASLGGFDELDHWLQLAADTSPAF